MNVVVPISSDDDSSERCERASKNIISLEYNTQCSSGFKLLSLSSSLSLLERSHSGRKQFYRTIQWTSIKSLVAQFMPHKLMAFVMCPFFFALLCSTGEWDNDYQDLRRSFFHSCSEWFPGSLYFCRVLDFFRVNGCVWLTFHFPNQSCGITFPNAHSHRLLFSHWPHSERESLCNWI